MKLIPVIGRTLAFGRPMEIHKKPCKRCPSVAGPDPESQDIKEHWSRADQVESVFNCGWRMSKACKGYCDFLGVTEAELVAAREAGR